jgi:hypothetical protein
MSPQRWVIQVDRVVVRGAAPGLDAGELRALVDTAVGDALRDAPLPGGRTMRLGEVVHAGPGLAEGPIAVSRAIAVGITRAAGSGSLQGRGPSRG